MLKPNSDDPTVTVVIPARNEEESLDACLDSIAAQDWLNLEIIVVDGASTDSTADIVRRRMKTDSRIVLLSNPRSLIPVSLNMALAASTAEWLVRVDAHSTVPPDYVRRALGHLRTGNFGGVGGRKDGIGRTPGGRAVAAAMSSKFGVGSSRYHWGTTQAIVDHVPFGSYPTALLRELGGWDESLAVNQDFELDHRVRTSGHDILFDPALVIEWECRQSLTALYTQYRRYGRGKVSVAVLHPRSVRGRHLAAPALVAYLVALTGLSTRKPRLAVLGTLPYVAGLALATASAGSGMDLAARTRLPGAFLAMHIGWGTGFWSGLIKHLLHRRAA